jgi:hypothetical protein
MLFWQLHSKIKIRILIINIYLFIIVIIKIYEMWGQQ